MSSPSPYTINAPKLVRPRAARAMLGCSAERLYRLLNAHELESFRDGRARRISVASIDRYIAQRLADAGGPPSSMPAAIPPRRGRPRKTDPVARHEAT
jgi:excisionase family DNA binding protein